MQMEKDWLQFQRFNLSVTNALLKRPRCKRGRDGADEFITLDEGFEIDENTQMYLQVTKR